jgi:hypothetical protein
MEFLETSLNDFDILVVTETHLDNQINDSDITLDSFPNIIHRKRELCHYHLFGYQGVFQLQLIYRNHSKRFQGTPFYF